MKFRPLTWLFAALVAAVLGTASNARATLVLQIFENGSLAASFAGVDSISLDQTALDALVNPFLVDYRFTEGLGAASNAASGSGVNPAFVFQSGTVERVSTSGAATIRILAFDDGFTFQPVPTELGVSATGNYSFVRSTDTQSFTGTFEPLPSGTSVSQGLSLSPGATGPGPFSDSKFVNGVALGTQPNTYRLLTDTVISLGPNGLFSSRPSVSFTGRSVVTGIIPEPASVLLLGSALPLLVVGMARRRRSSV